MVTAVRLSPCLVLWAVLICQLASTYASALDTCQPQFVAGRAVFAEDCKWQQQALPAGLDQVVLEGKPSIGRLPFLILKATDVEGPTAVMAGKPQHPASNLPQLSSHEKGPLQGTMKSVLTTGLLLSCHRLLVDCEAATTGQRSSIAPERARWRASAAASGAFLVPSSTSQAQSY